MKLHPILITFCLFILLSSSVLAFDTPRNILGTVTGPCSANANVSVIGYCLGQLGNPGCIEDSANTTTNGLGAYATVITDFDPGPDAAGAVGLDVLVTVTNPSCSGAAMGNNSATATVIVNTINVNITNPFTLTSPGNGSSTSDNTTTFTWSNTLVNANYTLLVDNNSDFSSPERNITNITLQTHTLAAELSDGTYYWRVLGYQNTTFIQQSGRFSFILSTQAPQITNISPANTTWIAAASTTLQILTDTTANCAYATSSGVAFGAKTPFTTTGTTTHSTTVTLASQDNNTFYLQCNGTNGALMPTDNVTVIYRDTVAPSAGAATVSIEGGAVYATNSTINLSWAGFTDASSGVNGYYINITNNQGTTGGTFYGSSPGVITGVGDGLITAYVWAQDVAGNLGLAATDTITVDTTAPTYGTWSSNPANINQFTTSNYQFFVTITDSSLLAGLPEARYRIGNDAWSAHADMTLVGGGIYSFTIPNQAPPNDWASRIGENLTYVVNATDIHGFTSNGSNYEYINNQVTIPSFVALSNVNVNEGSQILMTLTATDADGDSLTFSSNSSDFSIVAVNTSEATATWTPGNDDVGIHYVNFTVTDGTYNVSQVITITVANVNDEPVLQEIGELNAYEYIQFNTTINATDADNDNLTFSTNSSFFTVGSTSGIIRFTPIATHRGSHTISFTVSDGNGGTDSENVTFTVLYCGDGVCSSAYEDEDSCQVECEEEDEQDSQGFIISSKTCLGDTLDIHAVELVKRTTCDTKGIIINGLETCANMSSTTVNIEQKISDIYVSVYSLVTDDYGKTSFKPNETGEYRVRYDSTDFDENIVYFTVRECTADEQETPTADTREAIEDREVELPLFEEPQEISQRVILTQARKIVYFVLLPLLFVLGTVASLSTYYNYGRKKGGNDFTNQVDILKAKVKAFVKQHVEKIKKSPYYAQVMPILSQIGKEIHTYTDKVLIYFEPLFSLKKINVPYFPIKVGAHKEQDMVLLSLLSYKFKGKNFETFLEALEREKKTIAQNVRAFALQAVQFGLPIQYHFSLTKDKNELLSLHQVAKVHKSYPTVTELKLHIMKGRPVVVPLHMNALNRQAPQQNFFAIIRGFDKKGFYMADYSFSRKNNTFVPYEVFKKAWEKTGYIECFILK